MLEVMIVLDNGVSLLLDFAVSVIALLLVLLDFEGEESSLLLESVDLSLILVNFIT